MVRKIRTNIEVSGCAYVETLDWDLPERWDEMTQEERDVEIASFAEGHLENSVSCGGYLVDVEE